MTFNSLGFIGGGRISYLLIKRLSEQSALPQQVIVSDPDEEALKRIASINKNNIQTVDNNSKAANSKLVFLAVHPQVLEEVRPEIKDNLKSDSILISFLPTVTRQKLTESLDGFDRIVRMIPNAPSITGNGFNPVCYSETVLDSEKDSLQSLFDTWGEAPQVKEEKLKLYAIFTAMGPTYFWFQWLELEKLATDFGIDKSEAQRSLNSMLKGASETLFNFSLSSEEVLDLIPTHPLKKNENTIQNIISDKLEDIHNKLSSK